MKDQGPIGYTLEGNKIYQTAGPSVQGEDPVVKLFNHHLAKLRHVDIIRMVQMETEFQKEVDIILRLRKEEQIEAQDGMWNKFKTFVKKEIDEFKQDQENKKKIENMRLTQGQAKIRFIKLLEL